MRTLALALLLTSCCFGQVTGTAAAPSSDKDTSASRADRPAITDLAQVKRIYVASFGDDEVSKQLQATVVASLVGSKKFIVTENEKKADATLKGSGTYKSTQELHQYSSGTAVANGRGAAGIRDSSTNTETVETATIALRLVNSDGDVIWTTTEESKGAKFKGAIGFVSDKAVAQLVRDQERSASPHPSTSK